MSSKLWLDLDSPGHRLRCHEYEYGLYRCWHCQPNEIFKWKQTVSVSYSKLFKFIDANDFYDIVHQLRPITEFNSVTLAFCIDTWMEWLPSVKYWNQNQYVHIIITKIIRSLWFFFVSETTHTHKARDGAIWLNALLHFGMWIIQTIQLRCQG